MPLTMSSSARPCFVTVAVQSHRAQNTRLRSVVDHGCRRSPGAHGRKRSTAVRMCAQPSTTVADTAKTPDDAGLPVQVSDDDELSRLVTDSLAIMRRLGEFSNQTIVVKYGGAAMKSDELKGKVMQDVAALNSCGIKVLLVHGGGPEVNNWLSRLNIEAQFCDGLRVTDAATMEVVEMALAGKVNKELVSLVNVAGGRAIGLCGKDGGGFVRAKQKRPELGFVGEVTSVDADFVLTLLDAKWTPVISSIASDAEGQSYNINADELAGDIARAIRADKLVLMTDVPGVMADFKDPSSVYHRLDETTTKELIEKGVVSGGMIPKVMSCMDALNEEVKAVHIIDGRRPHALLLELLSAEGIGTMFLK